MPVNEVLPAFQCKDILLDVLLFSIAEHFNEL